MPLTDRDRRTLIVGGSILGVLLVGFFLFNALSGGGGEEAIPSLPPISSSPGGGGVPTTNPSATPGTGVSPQPVFTGRDPFSIPPALASATGTTTGPTSPGSTTTPPTTTPPTNTATTTPPTTPGGGSSTVKGGKTVVLLDTFKTQSGQQMAQVEVDGTVYNVGIGETFGGGTFELRSISGDCATFVFGDEPFTLCANSTK
jgi:hypothetical protein